MAWKEYVSSSGKPYYHDPETGATQWSAPPNFGAPKPKTAAADAALRKSPQGLPARQRTVAPVGGGAAPNVHTWAQASQLVAPSTPAAVPPLQRSPEGLPARSTSTHDAPFASNAPTTPVAAASVVEPSVRVNRHGSISISSAPAPTSVPAPTATPAPTPTQQAAALPVPDATDVAPVAAATAMDYAAQYPAQYPAAYPAQYLAPAATDLARSTQVNRYGSVSIGSSAPARSRDPTPAQRPVPQYAPATVPVPAPAPAARPQNQYAALAGRGVRVNRHGSVSVTTAPQPQPQRQPRSQPMPQSSPAQKQPLFSRTLPRDAASASAAAKAAAQPAAARASTAAPARDVRVNRHGSVSISSVPTSQSRVRPVTRAAPLPAAPRATSPARASPLPTRRPPGHNPLSRHSTPQRQQRSAIANVPPPPAQHPSSLLAEVDRSMRELAEAKKELQAERDAHRRTQARLDDSTNALSTSINAAADAERAAKAAMPTANVDAMFKDIEALQARNAMLESEVADLSAERSLAVAFIRRNIERLSQNEADAATGGTPALVDDGSAAFFESMSHDAMKTAALLDIERRALADDNTALRRQLAVGTQPRGTASPSSSPLEDRIQARMEQHARQQQQGQRRQQQQQTQRQQSAPQRRVANGRTPQPNASGAPVRGWR